MDLVNDMRIREDGSEQLQYNTPEFPVRTRTSLLSSLPGYAAACHWHEDFEALLAMEGDMDYFVNGQRVHLNEGEAIFVNSGRLHYGYSADHAECLYQFVVFHPHIFGFFESIVQPLHRFVQDDQSDFWVFSTERETDAPLLDCLRGICTHARHEPALRVLSRCALLMDGMLQLIHTPQPPQKHDTQWDVLRSMLGFVQEHYATALTLDDIAASGAVCRSRCCRIFRDCLNATPIGYLTQYRMEKACTLLRESALPITEIAQKAGFSGASYFAETFKRHYGISPREFRQKQ